MSILQTIQGSLGHSEISQIGEQLGLDPQTTQNAVSAALPMIVGGLAGHATQSPEGASAVQDAMAIHEDAIDDVSETVQTPPPSTGFLSRIFGPHQETVQQGVQQASGLGFDKVKQLLAIISPLVLSALARARQGSQHVGGLLQQEAQNAQAEMPHMSGMLGKLLSAF